MKKTTAILLLAVLAGCGSDPKKDDQPQPRIEEKPVATTTTSERQAAPDKEEPIAITIKKGDRRMPEGAYTETPPPGYVAFDFKNMDLATMALPLFSKQAGVIVEYSGKTPRKLTLNLHRPTPWRDALGLICNFTQTHVIRSQIGGRLELKEGFADPGPLLAKFDPNDKSAAGQGQGTIGGGPAVSNRGSTGSSGSSGGSSGSSGSSSSASGGGDAQPYDTSDYGPQPKGTGADRIDELRRGVTPTNSGVK